MADKRDTSMQGIIEVKEFEFHSLDDAKGTFSGVAAMIGSEDLGNDLIEEGAFDKTLKENPIVPVLLQHDSREVIGEGSVEIAGKKVIIKGQLDMDDPVAVRTLGKMKKKLIKSLSIGFQALRVTWEETKDKYIRHIDELKLWEVSVVTFPMQPRAVVTSVKALSNDPEFEKDVRELRAGRKISASSRQKIQTAITELQALLDDAGDASTSDDDAKTAPEMPPPGLLDRIENMRSLIVNK